MKTYTGIVQKGVGRGAALGFPTANISLEDKEPSGIYAARVTVGETSYAAAAFADQKRGLLEAHILDASLDLYGKEISIELLKKLRDTKMFSSDDELRATIAGDAEDVQDYFRAMKTS